MGITVTNVHKFMTERRLHNSADRQDHSHRRLRKQLECLAKFKHIQLAKIIEKIAVFCPFSKERRLLPLRIPLNGSTH